MTTVAPVDVVPGRRTRSRAGWLASLVVLFKLRIVVLLLLAAVGGAMISGAGTVSAGDLVLLLVTGGLSAAGASALNQYVERHKDGAMKRTSRRPLVTGEVNARWVLVVAAAMVVGASLRVGGGMRRWRSGSGGRVLYVGITIWLKRAAQRGDRWRGGQRRGASSSAAAGNWADPGMIIAGCCCSRGHTHFWSLALAYRSITSGPMPMLPVVVSQRESCSGCWHTLATAIFEQLAALARWAGLIWSGAAGDAVAGVGRPAGPPVSGHARSTCSSALST